MKPTIFFAIPCGGFYNEQRRIIDKVCDAAGIDSQHRIIVEDDVLTNELWLDIIEKIDRADYFVADVSSTRPNIILELGYALKAKHKSKVAFFISRNIRTPSDLGGQKRHEYSSFNDFQKQVIEWLKQAVGIEAELFKGMQRTSRPFKDSFQDFDRFLSLWSTPTGCQWNLTHEGLQFSNAYFPILTKTLKLLANFQFIFTAKIVEEKLGWVIKGTIKDNSGFPSYLPSFCIMFNITDSGLLTPHILNHKHIHPTAYYQPFNSEAKQIGLQKSKDGWFTITTLFKDDVITVSGGRGNKFEADFKNTLPYSTYYDADDMHGQVGFRCAPSGQIHRPGEVAIIRDVTVREL